tara:strand:+ start:835 stop:1479 length:645 start_codon:yes stop_codon:yes gene_type:complete
MSTLNVDNINEYTTDGKVNVGHDIKLASGKSVLDSDGNATGALVKLMTSTASNASVLIQDNFVDNTKYSQYLVVWNDVVSATAGQHFYVGYRSGGASGANLDGTFRSGWFQTKLNQDSSNLDDNRSYNNTTFVNNSIGGDNNNEKFSGQLKLFPFPDGPSYMIIESLANRNDGDLQYFHMCSAMETSTQVTGLRWHMGSGNIESGDFHIYGVSK